jgi:hypothetical protein
MIRRPWVALLLCVGLFWMSSFALLAGGSRADVRNQAEAGMLLTGTIDLARDGKVSAYAIDKADQVPAVVTALIAKVVPQWRFEPVTRDGHPIAARTSMNLHVLAGKDIDSNYRISISGVSFGSAEGNAEGITSRSMKPPSYPTAALSSGVEGLVYLVLRVDRQGNVDQAIVEQVNLGVVAKESEMEAFRAALGRTALTAAKRWTFNIPRTTDVADDEFWTVRVPVGFQIVGTGQTKYGEWEAYIPGPRVQAPWLHLHDLDDWSPPDTLTAGRLYEIGKGPRLLTPPGKS